MADWRVIENTGQTLVGLVERHVAQLGIPNVGVGVVTPMAFPSLADTTDPFVSLFLYQIAGNAEMRGNPRRVLANGTLGRQPLPLELCYLVTAWGVRATDDVIGDLPATQDEARLLGAVLQAFYDNAELDRSSLFEVPGLPVWSPEDGLQIVMETLPSTGITASGTRPSSAIGCRWSIASASPRWSRPTSRRPRPPGKRCWRRCHDRDACSLARRALP